MQHPPCNSKDVRQHPPPPPHSLRITYLASLLLPRISLPHLPSLVFPPPRSTQGPDIVSTGMDLDPLIFDRAVSSALPMVPIEFFTSLFSLLSPNIVTSLVSLLLMESPLLLVSRELSALTNISEALCALLFPLSWCGIYIPVTPRGFDLDAALEAPLPFIIGTNVGDHTSAEGTARRNALYEEIVADTEPVDCSGPAGTVALWHRATMHKVATNYSRAIRFGLIYDFLSNEDLGNGQAWDETGLHADVWDQTGWTGPSPALWERWRGGGGLCNPPGGREKERAARL